MVGFFSAIAFSSGNDEEKRELMSKKEVTERYDKNGDGELDYREKMTFLRELVESGEITEEQARRRMENMRRRAAESLNSEHGERHHGERDNDKRGEGIRARLDEAGKKLRELVESGEITEEQARRRMENMRRRAAESLNGEHRDRHHDGHENGDRNHDGHGHRDRHHDGHENGDRNHDGHEHMDRHHDGHENGDRHHDGHEHRDRHHDGHENEDRHHDGHEHRGRHHDGHENGDRHHDDYASEIKKHFMEIEVKLLIEKYSEISKLIHQLDLDLINMEVDYETAEEEEEKKEISRLLKRKSLLWDRLNTKLHQTRDKILNLGHENDEHEVKSHHEDEKFKEYIEGLIQERRSANARLEELFEGLKQLDETDDESADAEREQIEIRIHRLESHLDKLTKELESIDN